jgi:S1-C subfamily serine protease
MPSDVCTDSFQQVRGYYSTDTAICLEAQAGSGFLWDTDAHVVTNYHVIKGASDLQVRSIKDLGMAVLA